VTRLTPDALGYCGARFSAVKSEFQLNTSARRPLILIALLGGLACFSASAQEYPKPKNPFDTSPLYNAVLNILFPCERPEGDFGVFITLRSSPSARYENESQINILQDDSGKFLVVQYFTPSGSESIGDQLGDLYVDDKLSPTDDPAELAKRFKVEARTVDIPGESLIALLNELNDIGFPSIHLDPPEKQSAIRSLILDGVSYEFSYWTNQSEVHTTYGNPKSRQGNVKQFGEWIERLENAINSAPSAMIGPDLTSSRTSGKLRSGLILGYVQDAAYVEIPGASVSVIEKKSNARIASLQSDQRGEFVVPDLQPGDYTVTVQLENPRIRFTEDVSILPAKQTYVGVRAEGRVARQYTDFRQVICFSGTVCGCLVQ
jgi:hypothetical protein